MRTRESFRIPSATLLTLQIFKSNHVKQFASIDFRDF